MKANNMETSAVPQCLHERLHEFSHSLTPAELDNYKMLLCMAAGGLAPHGDLPTEPRKVHAFRSVLTSLSMLQRAGVLWRGEMSVFPEGTLKKLQDEAIVRRATAKSTERHFLGCGGPFADQFARSHELAAFVEQLDPEMEPTGIASYVYYDAPGCGLDPHIDTEVFSLNLIIMLHHQYSSDPSHLLIFDPDGTQNRVLLTVGQCLLLYAGGTIHAREDMKQNESLSLLTIGFQKRT